SKAYFSSQLGWPSTCSQIQQSSPHVATGFRGGKFALSSTKRFFPENELQSSFSADEANLPPTLCSTILLYTVLLSLDRFRRFKGGRSCNPREWECSREKRKEALTTAWPISDEKIGRPNETNSAKSSCVAHRDCCYFLACLADSGHSS
ncbi:unnamed protein product, partial [Protopolystoma xenopodis]